VVTAACVIIWPHERLLLQKARRIDIVKLPDDYPKLCEWISDHEIAEAWAPLGANTAKLVVSDTANVVVSDLNTGKRRTFTAKLLKPAEGGGRDVPIITPSPGGRWALCWDEYLDHIVDKAKVAAVDLRTGRTLTWPSRGDCYFTDNLWMADGVRWLQFTTINDGYVTLYSTADPGLAIRLSFPHADTMAWRHIGWRHIGRTMTHQNHLLIVTYNFASGDTPCRLDICDYRLLPSLQLSHTFHVAPSVAQLADTGCEAVVVSPAGDRIAWIYSQAYVSPLFALLHRWVPRIPNKPQHRNCLYVSHLDGSHFTEIGHIDAPPPPGTEDDADILDLNWLPSGKGLSFVYHDALYIVPVE
jgi:hypothetical protein